MNNFAHACHLKQVMAMLNPLRVVALFLIANGVKIGVQIHRR